MADFQEEKSLNFRHAEILSTTERYELKIVCLYEIKAISDKLNYDLINTAY